MRPASNRVFPNTDGNMFGAIPYRKLGVTDAYRRIAVVDQQLPDAFCIDIVGMYEDGASDVDDTSILRMFKYPPNCVVICFDNFAWRKERGDDSLEKNNRSFRACTEDRTKF